MISFRFCLLRRRSVIEILQCPSVELYAKGVLYGAHHGCIFPCNKGISIAGFGCRAGTTDAMSVSFCGVRHVVVNYVRKP